MEKEAYRKQNRSKKRLLEAIYKIELVNASRREATHIYTSKYMGEGIKH